MQWIILLLCPYLTWQLLSSDVPKMRWFSVLCLAVIAGFVLAQAPLVPIEAARMVIEVVE